MFFRLCHQAASPVEVTRAALARIEAWEKKINAMYVVDAAGALAQATASEARWCAGTPLSVLDVAPKPTGPAPLALVPGIPVMGSKFSPRPSP
jgi:hypothetical protein